jgi:hypothetical protein
VLDLETLTALEEIRRLEARYARYADHKRWSDLAGLFAEDGWFRPLDADGNEIFTMAGRTEIAEQLTARNSGDVQPIHQLFTPEIELQSPISATAIWAMTDLIVRGDDYPREPDAFRTMRGWGHYHVTYRKVDGQWLIATRTLTRTRLEYTY